jgi:uncharacterized LabA/DUF88 family protein
VSGDAKLAVLIDADNAQPAIIKGLLAKIAKYGTAHVKRACGDWTGTSLRGWKAHLLAESIQPIQQFVYTTGKNSTDAAMTIDAMDLLYTGRFDGFCIVSSDSDFTRLAARIRESGLTVYGFGEQKTPKPFVAACDKFIYTDKPAASTVKFKGDAAVINQLSNAIEAASADDGWASLAEVGQVIIKQQPHFSSREYGYAKLSDLITATSLFDTSRRSCGDGNSYTLYARNKQQRLPREQD